MEFNRRIENNVKRAPNKIILSDGEGDYTNSQMWDCSSRVYAYLIAKGIGKENVVLIHLPRSAEAVMVMVGVFRAGAALVILEDIGPNEWVDFVKKETKPDLVIDSLAMQAIRACAPNDGYVIPDMHDLAYIAYTTGTTGLSKGVLLEYGIFEQYFIYDEQTQPTILVEDGSLALTSTLHTSVAAIAYYLGNNAYVDLVPSAIFNCGPKFVKRLEDKKIRTTYMSPVYLHKHGIPYTPYLQYIYVGFEPVCNLYSNRVSILNEYGARELGSSVCSFLIDKPYDITPIGKPYPGFSVCILDEDNKPVKEGELGEICVENQYCRGYLNLPDVTAAQFRGGLYHTRDLGKRLPDGNYMMYGRMNDAVKTKNGLIVALEIETEARKVLGRPTVYVKVFKTEGNPIICLYADFDVDLSALRAKLKHLLPEYALPTNFVRVERFEYNNGKAIRVNLKNPRE